MTLFDFAKNNIIRDARTYVFYFTNCVSSVFVFFLFSVLSFHPAMKIIDKQSTMGLILTVGQLISTAFSFCFISYSVHMFLKRRKRQFGLLMICGATKKQLNKLLFFENSIVGFLAIGTGILFGLIASKLFLDFANVVIGVTDFVMYIPIAAIILTIVVMGALFLFIAVCSPYFIRKTEVIALLKEEVRGEKQLHIGRLSIFVALCMALILWVFLSGNQTAQNIQEQLVFVLFVLAVLSAVTYIIIVCLMKLWFILIKHSGKNNRLLLKSEFQSKERVNGQTITLSTILYTVSLLSMVMLLSLSSNVQEETQKIVPYAMSYNVWSDDTTFEKDVEQIQHILQSKTGYRSNVIDLAYVPNSLDRVYLISETQYNQIMKNLMREPIILNENEVFAVAGNVKDTQVGVIGLIRNKMQSLKIESNIRGYSNDLILLSGFSNGIAVLDDTMYQSMENGLSKRNIALFYYDGWEDDAEGYQQVQQSLLFQIEQGNGNLIAAYNYYSSSKLQNNLTLYIGTILCFTYILAIASFLYSRLYSELEIQCEKYIGLVKIGLSKKELIKLLNKTIMLLTLFPFGIAIMNMWIGIVMSESNVVVSSIPVAIIYTLIVVVLQFIIYFMISQQYRKDVLQRVYQIEEWRK